MTFTEKELVDLADSAEREERMTDALELKKAYGAIRQGADWLLRNKVKDRLKVVGLPKTVTES